MERKKINKFNTILPKKGAFTIDTEPDFPKMHTLCIASGKRGGGKSVAIANYVKKCKDKHYIDYCILITPTYNSNSQIWDIADIKEEHVLEPDMQSIKKVIQIIDSEHDEWDSFVVRKKEWKKYQSDKLGALEKITNNRLLNYYTLGFLDNDEPPEWKYPVEQPPRIALIVDDCLGTDLLARRTAGLLNFCIKHRHVSRGLGCSVFMLVQTYRSEGGLARAIRENTTLLLQFKVSDINQIKAIKDECDLPITDEEWEDLCAYAHATPFNPLIVDFAPKSEQQRFRSGWDSYIVPPSLKNK